MNKREKQEWQDLKERLITRWPGLANYDLDSTRGNPAALVAILETNLGYARSNAIMDLEPILSGETIVPDVADEEHHTGSSGPVAAARER